MIPTATRRPSPAAWAELKTGAGPIVANFEPNYEGSPLVFGPPSGVSRARGDYMFKARPGHHLAPRRYRRDAMSLRNWATDFALLVFDAEDDAVAHFEQSARTRTMPRWSRPRHLCGRT